MEVTPTHYSILSCASSQSAHPNSWCLEVSGDGKSWTKVHRCENNFDLNGSSQIGTYSVNRPVKWRFVQLRQTGKYSHSLRWRPLLSSERRMRANCTESSSQLSLQHSQQSSRVIRFGSISTSAAGRMRMLRDTVGASCTPEDTHCSASGQPSMQCRK
jgi:hypothetical protein